MKPVVSVVIPAKDRVEQLRSTLESVRLQSFVNFEVLVIENNSSHPEVIHDLVDEFDERFQAYSMVSCSNANQARNYGSSLAKGKYIAYLDSDDLWDIEHLAHIKQLFENNNVEFIYGGARIFDGQHYVVRAARDISDDETAADYLVGFKRGYAQTSSYVMLRDCFEKIQWDESYSRCQDLDFFIRAISNLSYTCSSKITTTIIWKRGDVRDYNVKAMLKFYRQHYFRMKTSSRVRYLLLIFKVCFLSFL